MQGRKRNLIDTLWIGRRPADVYQEIAVDGVDCYITQTIGPGTSPMPRLTPRLSWDEFISEWRFKRVIDHGGAGAERRLETLFPVLEPGGSYQMIFYTSCPESDPEGRLSELMGRLDSYFAGYLKRFAQEVTSVSGGIRFVKQAFNQWIGRVVALDEVSPHARQSLYDADYDRVPAMIYGSDRHRDMVSRATSGFRSQHVGGQRWLELADAVVEGYGQIHPSDDTVLAESFSHLKRSKRGLLHCAGNTNWMSSEVSLVPRKTLSFGKPCLVLKQPWDGNYGHWLVDNFSRLAGAQVIDFDNVQFVLSRTKSGAMTRVMHDALGLLGVHEEQIVHLDMHPVRIDHVLYPEPITSAPFVKHPDAIRFLESLVSRAKGMGGRNVAPGGRVYISRNGGTRRRLLNEDDLLPLVLSGGYEVVCPEQLSFYDQIVTFGSATHVVGNMGAGFTNLVFSPIGVRVACLANTVMAHDYFYDIVCHKDGIYVGVQGLGARQIGEDFSIDVDLTSSVLRSHGFV